MKKVICNIEEDYNKYIFLIYLIKIKGKSYKIVNKAPFSINKNSLTNKNDLKDFIIMINKLLHNHKYSYANCIISINSFKTIRDEFTYPKISTNELKKVIGIEVSKRYGNNGIIYNKISKDDNKIRNNVVIINKSLRNMIDEVFDYINLKVKKILFLPEAVNDYVKKIVPDNNFFFLYKGKDYYLMNVVINKNVIYSSKQDKNETLLSQLLSIYGYYSNVLNNRIYISSIDSSELEPVKTLDLKKVYICSNLVLEIEALITKYLSNEYEKI